jgi:hypothetical protein
LTAVLGFRGSCSLVWMDDGSRSLIYLMSYRYGKTHLASFLSTTEAIYTFFFSLHEAFCDISHRIISIGYFIRSFPKMRVHLGYTAGFLSRDFPSPFSPGISGETLNWKPYS